MAEKANAVPVEIFGQTYAIRSGSEPEHVEALAARVDAEMREVSRSGGAVDSVRIAVLAALNIADECARLRASLDELETEVRRKTESLARDVLAVLED
jgi:cell division protein ZapA